MSSESDRATPTDDRDSTIDDLIDNFNRVLTPQQPANLDETEDPDNFLDPENIELNPENTEQEQVNMANIVPPAIVNNDYRADQVRSRAGFKGHHTRALQKLEAWAARIDRALVRADRDNTQLKSEDFEADLGEFDDFIRNVQETWEKVVESNQEVLDQYDGSQVLAQDLRPDEDSMDPEIRWLASKEDTQIDVLRQARHVMGRLKRTMAEGDAMYARDHPTANDREKAAQRKLELRARFKIADLVGVFNGQDMLEYLPWRQQWKNVETEMKDIFTKAEMLGKLRTRLSGIPKNLIKGLTDENHNYDLAIQILDNRYQVPGRDAKALVEALIDIPPMMNDSLSTQEVFSCYLAMKQRLSGMGLTLEDKCFIYETVLLERKFNNIVKKYWFDKIREKADTRDKIGTTARDEEIEKVVMDGINYLTTVNGDQQKCQENKKKRETIKTQANKPKPKVMSIQNQTQNQNQTSSQESTKSMSIKDDDSQKQTCPYCDKTHRLSWYKCSKRPQDPQKDLEILKSKRRCYACLRKSDKYHNCTFPTCNIDNCGQRHLRIFHRIFQNNRNPKTNVAQINQSTQVNKPLQKGLLRTLKCWIIGPDGQRQVIRVALDSLSQISLIKRSLANDLGLMGPSYDLQLMVAGGGQTERTKEKRVHFKLQSLDNTFESPPIEAVTIKQINTDFEGVHFNPSKYNHLKGITFTEEYPSETAPVDILIGEPTYSFLEGTEKVEGPTKDTPRAVSTKLGWILVGSQPDMSKNCAILTNHINVKDIKTTELFPQEEIKNKILFSDLEHNVQQYLNSENLGLSSEDTNFTKDEQRALDIMKEKTFYNKTTKKWTTGLLWKTNPNEHLNHNLGRSMQVMHSVQNKLSVEDRKMVDDAYQEFLNNGSAEIIPKNQTWPKGKFVYFLETHPVFRKDKVTSKCRIVHNAASKDKTSKKSLNDLLYPGPCLLPHIAVAQLRFRLPKFVWIGDVSKMFLQVDMNPEDKDALRFVWHFKDKPEPTLMRMTCVTFGVCSSPFQADYCVRESAKMLQSKYPEASRIVLEGAYVDDITGGSDIIKKSTELLDQVIEIYKFAGMKLHKICANHPDIIKHLQQDQITPMDLTKVLGTVWDPKNDTLNFNYNKLIENPELKQIDSKRKGLGIVASLYDSPGLIAPFVLLGKLLVRKTWEQSPGWDSQLSEELKAEFQKWAEQIKELSNVHIDRWIGGNDIKLYIFGDASNQAYGAVAYAKVGNTFRLVFSKTRVSPKDLTSNGENRYTIARLELLAAVCCAKIGEFLREHLKIDKKDCIFFTDSAITLARIKKGPTSWKTWVANRIQKIMDTTEQQNWHYCPTKENPADLASRGLNAKELIQSNLWWKGPKFALMGKEKWPKVPSLSSVEKEVDTKERKPVIHMNTKITETPVLSSIIQNMSSWTKAKRATANILKWKYKSKTSHELEQLAEIKLIKTAQLEEYKKEMECTINKVPVPNTSKLAQYELELDDNGILRFQTRLHTDLEDLARPIILPKHHKITELIVLHYHTKTGHVGINTVIGELHQKYKIIGGRREISRIIHNCKKKFCRNPIPQNQRMADLPKERVEFVPGFTYIALDYFGPLKIKQWQKHEEQNFSKVWGCIFTCLSTRAIHIELVEDLTSRSFIEAFRRFVGRRGYPQKIWSDNATTFKLAAKELKSIKTKKKSELLQNFQQDLEKVQSEEASIHEIQWNFTVPESPWQNGITERMVQIVKKILLIKLGNLTLTLRQLETIMIECEAIVNRRPLAVVLESQHGHDVPITPAKLLYGKDLIPIPSVQVKQSSISNAWKHRKTLLGQFWTKFKNEYITSLQPRQKWKNVISRDAQVGDIVLIKEDNLSKNEWKIAKVTKVFPDKKGIIRHVELQRPDKLNPILRHINRIGLLEGQETNFENNSTISLPKNLHKDA